jgi:uncharacterized membrane protein YgdD (TMEM256/DUF423 family)
LTSRSDASHEVRTQSESHLAAGDPPAAFFLETCQPKVNEARNKSQWLAVGALLGAAGVTLGAFGAHGLSDMLANLGYEGADLDRRMANFETAVRYQMVHAVAIALVGVLRMQRPRRTWNVAAWAFLVGIVLFSGLLYVLSLAGPNWRWLGAVVPLGGVSLIAGWLVLAVGACKK